MLFKARHAIFIILMSIILFSLNSCSSCVKQLSKKTTETVGSAIEGINEAVLEDEGKLAENTTDAAGSVTDGVGRSVDRQLDENTESIFKVAGRTVIQAADGLIEVLEEDIEKKRFVYDTLQYTATLPPDVTIDCVAKSKGYIKVIDIYYQMPLGSDYIAEYYGLDKSGELVYKWEDMPVFRPSDDRRSFTVMTFKIGDNALNDFYKIKRMNIVVKDRKDIDNIH